MNKCNNFEWINIVILKCYSYVSGFEKKHSANFKFQIGVAICEIIHIPFTFLIWIDEAIVMIS